MMKKITLQTTIAVIIDRWSFLNDKTVIIE